MRNRSTEATRAARTHLTPWLEIVSSYRAVQSSKTDRGLSLMVKQDCDLFDADKAEEDPRMSLFVPTSIPYLVLKRDKVGVSLLGESLGAGANDGVVERAVYPVDVSLSVKVYDEDHLLKTKRSLRDYY